jgi:hypothetical protein
MDTSARCLTILARSGSDQPIISTPNQVPIDFVAVILPISSQHASITSIIFISRSPRIFDVQPPPVPYETVFPEPNIDLVRTKQPSRLLWSTLKSMFNHIVFDMAILGSVDISPNILTSELGMLATTVIIDIPDQDHIPLQITGVMPANPAIENADFAMT